MQGLTQDIDALAAPDRAGEVLVWPDGEPWTDLARRNRKLARANRVTLLDRPIAEWTPAAEADAFVFMAGHQPDLIHPGVWVKTLAIAEAARRAGGRAEFLLVDSDVPDALTLRWPVEKDGRIFVARATPTHLTGGSAFEQFPDLASHEWSKWFDGASSGRTDGPPTLISEFAAAFVADAPPACYPSRWRRAMAATHERFSATPIEFQCISEYFSFRDHRLAPTAAALLAHVVLHAPRLAHDYNAALDAYRRRRGIKGRRHPIPDLEVRGATIELPFWLLDAYHKRRRLHVTAASTGSIELSADQQPLATVDTRALRNDPVPALREALGEISVRPRALALTLFARLCACDLFVHGIGGAKYDRITDDIIRRFFGAEPPRFACASATLHLPLDPPDVAPRALDGARHRLRDVRFNPHRYLGQFFSGGDGRALIAERQAAIAEAARLRTEAPRDRQARREAFRRIRVANEAMLRAAPTMQQSLARQLEETADRIERKRITEDREWFFALYPLSSLGALAESIRRRVF